MVDMLENVRLKEISDAIRPSDMQFGQSPT